MSPELLLVLIAFVLLPLVQQLLGARALRREASKEQAAREKQVEQRPGMRTPPGRGPVGPPKREKEHRELADTATREPAPALLEAMPDLRLRPISPRPAAIPGLRNPRSLRRSIVLMTILGPCRTIEPYAWSERTGRR